jgi:hypothetical protein
MYHFFTNAVHRILLILWLYTIDKIWKCLSCGCNPYGWGLQCAVHIITAHLIHNTKYAEDSFEFD